MDKTTEQKIDEIHREVSGITVNVAKITVQMDADKTLCNVVHKTIDNRLSGIHTKVFGNGQPGLLQKCEALEKHFSEKYEMLDKRLNKWETRLIIWSSIAVFVGQLVAPILVDKVKESYGLKRPQETHAVTASVLD